MKRGLVLGLALAATAAATALAASDVAPSLRLVQRSPLVVSGQHFRSGERVTVTIVADGKWIRRPRATPAGTWRVKLPTVSVTRCDPLYVTAVGRRGSKAKLKVPLPPACIPE